MLDSIATTPWTPLSVKDMEVAILKRLNSRNRFGDERSTYVGASEVGDCPHRVAHRKLFPEEHEITDPASAGRMLGGQVMENLIVQIVRLSPLGAQVRDTGANQAEIILPDAPIRVHPDGTILKLPVPQGLSTALVLDPTGNLIEIPVDSLVGPGVFEIKTYGLGAFSALKKKGLAVSYQDQVQVQMGATGRKWALIVPAMREDASKCMIFLLRFDADRYEFLKAKARDIMVHVDAGTLPAPDATCGYCDSCPLKDECSAFASIAVEAGAVFPDDVALEVEVLAEEQLLLAPHAKRLEEVKDSLKRLFAAHPVESYFLLDGDFAGAKCSRRYTGARENCDVKKLKAIYPEAFLDTVTTSEPSLWVAVQEPKAPKGKK